MVTDHSPRSPAAVAAAAANGGVNSPQSRRRSLPSAWASVVRGDSEQISSPTAAGAGAFASAPPGSSTPPPEQAYASDNSVVESSGSEAQPESSDVNGEGNAGRPRRPAWNRPLNGVVETGSVMGGAVSWPALSESTRPVPRSSYDSSRPGSDGSASSSQAPVISPPPRRQANTNAHANSTANNTMPTRPRSRNRSGGGGAGSSSGNGPSQNNFTRPSPPTPPPPPFPIFELSYGMVPAILDTSVRGTRPVGGVGGSHSHVGNEHSSQRTTSRRGGNYGPRPRGDGSYNNNHGGRRDHDRRDVHLPPQYGPPPIGYMPSPLPPGAAPFMAPSPVRMFPGQMGFDMASPFIYVPTMHPETFRAMPMVSPQPPPMLFPPAENPLLNMIVTQIDYYFSDVNLVRDNFLRSNMDDHGWVPITLIASFPRVHQLTQDIPLILESLRYSTIVEVQGDKVRRRHEWNKWLNSNTDSGSRSPGAAPENALTVSFQDVSLDDTVTSANGNIDTREGHTEIATGRFLSEELANGDDSVDEVHSISL